MQDERSVRLEKITALRKQGVDPYPSASNRTAMCAEARASFDAWVAEGKTITLAGRMMMKRIHGSMLFADLRDASGSLQIQLTVDRGEDVFHQFCDMVDPGDFVQATGTLFHTKRGEPTLAVSDWKMLAKAILPLPEKWHGLQDVELRFRKRYLDLLVNPEVRERMEIRSKIISSIRMSLDERGYLEVETPTLQPVYGGGFARPFVTHHNALDADFYLRISDEMYLKRLLVGGFEGVYEITKVFRNEGIDHDHNPEFTMFEAQIAYKDYWFGMDLIEQLVEQAALHAIGTTQIQHGDVMVDVKRPWKRMRLVDAVLEVGGVDAASWTSVEQAKQVLAPKLPPRNVPELDRMHTLGEVVAFAFEELVEEQLIQPTIIYDYPVEVSPLAKKGKDSRYTERFEAFALGSEISNNYSELNDPVDLRQRFLEEKKKEEAGFDEAHQTDESYIEAIMHGLPPACGIALGVDRVVMLLTGAANIKEVILFPTLRPEHSVGMGSEKKQELRVAHAVILKKADIPEWSQLNAAAHLGAAFAAREGKKLLHIEETLTKDQEVIPMNIQHAIIMKETTNGKALLGLKRAGEDAGLVVACFTEDMRDSSNDRKVKARHESKDASEVVLLGVLVFGPKSDVEALTGSFPLVGVK